MVEVPEQGDPQNERCTCGALKSEHAEKVIGKIKGRPIVERFAGVCVRTGCQEFTWASFVKEPRHQ